MNQRFSLKNNSLIESIKNRKINLNNTSKNPKNVFEPIIDMSIPKDMKYNNSNSNDNNSDFNSKNLKILIDCNDD